MRGRERFWASLALLVALLAVVPDARADDEADSATPAVEAAPPIQTLPPVEIRAPRVEGGRTNAPAARSSAALRREALAFDVPAAVSVLEGEDLTRRRLVRTVPDALRRLPGVLVQKTAPNQGSPFIRGFTGYQNLLLIDGVRLNHSAMRSGPNQYWGTIDPYTMGRLEVVRGPHSVLYGSDAVGGTVDIATKRRESFAHGIHTNTRIFTRGASAESMLGGRVEFEGNRSNFGWLGGLTARRFGDIVSGAGLLPETGGIEELAGDLRFDYRLNRAWTLTLAGQKFEQKNAPRTEKTIFAVPFHGTSVGSELRRDQDQERTLIYGRATYDGGGRVERGSLTLSWQRHAEERDRLRTGDRQDLQGFTLNQFGVAVQFESRTRFGHLTYGAEWYHDEVDSFRRNFVAGVEGSPTIQGAVGDDARYDLLGVYIQDHLHRGRWDVFAGARFTYARAEANRVDNPAVPGSDPSTPGNVIQVKNDWTNVVGSLKATYAVSSRVNLYGSISQGFRAPSLSDLTALDSTSGVETPAPDLRPEKTLAFEVGAKTEQRRFSADVAAWYTRLDDFIIASPTGTVIGGTQEVRKDNIGDGYALGVELAAALEIGRSWTVFGNAGWMDSSVKELDAAGALVDSHLSRQNPFHSTLGLRLEPRSSRGWVQTEWEYAGKADKLSLRDQGDTRRIPSGGTPAWSIVNLRGGYRLGAKSTVTLAIENLFDANYRTHGSGLNEPGINVVFGFVLDW